MLIAESVAGSETDRPVAPNEVGEAGKVNGGSQTAVGAGLFRIAIKLAANVAGTVPVADSLPVAANGEPVSEGVPPAPLFVLVGDAAVTAHYRLGVGVNHAFANVRDLSDLIRSLSPPGADAPPPKLTAAAAGQYNVAVSKRGVNLVQFQLFAMYFEAHCGLVVIKDQIHRHTEDGDLERLRSAAEQLDECQERNNEAKRAAQMNRPR